MIQHQVSLSMRMLRVGLWTETQPYVGGGLLQTNLIQQAIAIGVEQWMVWRAIAGSHAHRGYRSFIHEVSATDLPILLEFSAPSLIVRRLLPGVRRHLAGAGVLVEGAGGFLPEQYLAGSSTKESVGVTLEQEGIVNGEMPMGWIAGLQVDLWTTEQVSVDGNRLYLLVAERMRSWGATWVGVFRGIEGMTRDMRNFGWGWPWQRRSTPIRVMVLDKRTNLVGHLSELSALVGDQGILTVQSVTWYEDGE